MFSEWTLSKKVMMEATLDFTWFRVDLLSTRRDIFSNAYAYLFLDVFSMIVLQILVLIKIVNFWDDIDFTFIFYRYL